MRDMWVTGKCTIKANGIATRDTKDLPKVYESDKKMLDVLQIAFFTNVTWLVNEQTSLCHEPSGFVDIICVAD